jgi:hypothetical protein
MHLVSLQKISSLTMPLPTSASNSIDGPHKQRPTERVIENGDPLAQKKAKIATTARDVQKISGSMAPTIKSATKSSKIRCASVEDVLEPTSTLRAQPHNSDRILEAADGSDDNEIPGLALEDDDHDMPGLADVEEGSGEESDDEEEPEDDEVELRKSQFACITFQAKISQ